ncbi:MAG: sensor domain-containing diguanylate cyclase [Alphaproteobacteria bacterium]|nr:MAG: sensor domain-containing diguanylate cyclase [Alphaproteobacteria bacterium]
MCAEVVKVASLKTGGSKNTEDDADWVFDAATAVKLFTGPALVVSEQARPLLRNVHSDVLVEALDDPLSPLRGLVARCLDILAPQFQKLTVNATAGARYFEVYAVPLYNRNREERGGTPNVLLIGRESTLDHNLTKALVESRQMFKDLVGCSADFAWETDSQGILRYVSPRGGFGYRAHDLTGRCAADLLAPDQKGDNPFIARQRVDGETIFLRRADGSIIPVSVSATPILNQKGEWLGARGLCHDIEALNRSERARREADVRLALNRQLIDTARKLVTPKRLFNAMAEIIASSLNTSCLILDCQDTEVYCRGASPDAFAGETLTAISREVARIAESHRTSARRIYRIVEGDTGFDVVPLVHQSTVQGALVVMATDQNNSDHRDELLDDICDHLVVALDLAEKREKVRALTRADELTGLMTGRAFEEEVEKRIAHQQRTGAPGTLLLVAVDDFDQITDRFGRASSEVVLQKVGRLLSTHSRVGDLIGRFHDALFGLWLEGASEAGARRKARMIINSMHDLSVGAPSRAVSLSVCAGGAIHLAGHETDLDRLMARAQTALREAQERGRGQWALAISKTDGDNDV